MLSLLKNIFIVLALVATVGLGYFMYTQRNNGLSDSSNSALANDVAAEAAAFLERLNELKSIELETDILSDPRFSSLSNFTAPTQAEPIGRSNPFELN